MTIRHFASITVLAAIAAGGSLALRGVAKEMPVAKPDQLEQLQRRVEQLERRVTELERRTPPVATAITLPPVERMPPGSEPREFNGQRYYIVPLDGSASK